MGKLHLCGQLYFFATVITESKVLEILLRVNSAMKRCRSRHEYAFTFPTIYGNVRHVEYSYTYSIRR